MLGLCPQIERGQPRLLPAVTKNQKSASGTLSWSRTVGRNSEAYCATRVGDGEGGIRFAIPPYALKWNIIVNEASFARWRNGCGRQRNIGHDK
jgi:hypothetical protein